MAAEHSDSAPAGTCFVASDHVAFGPTASGLAVSGLAASDPAASGLAASGLAASGLAAPGLAASGLQNTPNNTSAAPPDAPAALAGRSPAAAAPTTRDTAMKVDQASKKRTAGDRPEQFQSELELPPTKSPFNLSQDKEREKQGNHPYG